VRDQTVVENGIALVENIYVVTDLNLKRALNDNVKFLTLVRGKLYGSVLLLGKIGELDQKRFGKLFLELGRKVVIFNAVLL
jgi:hypothetical protein